MTKEPKLDRARRQVPEWGVYDDEIAGVFKAAREGKVGEELGEELGGRNEKSRTLVEEVVKNTKSRTMEAEATKGVKDEL
ncbi:hypothetical protein GMDG_03064 [Pseudogymnoascus destructans 20631-21]|uniref:Uncharacterized protein n=2 Tax=Pseudogymnoascus destructans TaxID=655981 RepID=L8G6G3_PSED2|nr:hypothetical protein GMDG_03064 [Pseudogymnoascus destructans 20631-21]